MTQPMTHWPTSAELPLLPGRTLHVQDPGGPWVHEVRVDRVQPASGGDWAICTDSKSGLTVSVFCVQRFASGSHPRIAP